MIHISSLSSLDLQDILSESPTREPPPPPTHLSGKSFLYHRNLLTYTSPSEPQGKGLGGSSAINGQAFIAPAQADIDAWAKLGNPGWDWSGLAPFYKKSYTLLPPSDQETLDHLGIDWINDKYRGTEGPIKVSFPGIVQNPLCKAWIDAFRALNKVTNGGA